jgi:small subunit ribosomal protein S14
MRLKKKLLNDIIVRKNFLKNESKIKSLKILIRLGCLNYLEILNNFSKLKFLSSLSKVKNRCFVTSRSSSISKKLSLSRIKMRELVNNALVPGFKKYSW